MFSKKLTILDVQVPVLLIKGPFWSSGRYIVNSVVNKTKKNSHIWYMILSARSLQFVYSRDN